MPVAIPASITSSNVHVPAAVPVSLTFRLFEYLLYSRTDLCNPKIHFMKLNSNRILVASSIYSLIFIVIT